MTKNEHQMYSDVSSIAKSLEKIANVLEHVNHDSYLAKQEIPKSQDIPGFEDTLKNMKAITDNYASLVEFTDDYASKHDTKGIKVDSDHDIRSTARYYGETVLANGGTKKECILDYVTNEFGSHGARYTDIIKFAYYLGAPNSSKYTNENRGYYACAFSTRHGGHLIQGGKDFLVKGINKEGNERYFALSFVECVTDYWKRIA
jgi:hypothetical protein